MNLDNPVENIVHYLLIGGMTCLSRQDGFPMVSALLYVMYIGQDLWWIMTQDYQLSRFTQLLYCMDFQPWEDIKSVSKLIGDFDLWVRP